MPHFLRKATFNVAVPSSVQTDITQSMIAKAAYFKAEKRNFVQGYELQDWIEAEHELHNAIEKQDTD